jgi:hypothetical protein
MLFNKQGFRMYPLVFFIVYILFFVILIFFKEGIIESLSRAIYLWILVISFAVFSVVAHVIVKK